VQEVEQHVPEQVRGREGHEDAPEQLSLGGWRVDRHHDESAQARRQELGDECCGNAGCLGVVVLIQALST
jgi:hypothetical protein